MTDEQKQTEVQENGAEASPHERVVLRRLEGVANEQTVRSEGRVTVKDIKEWLADKDDNLPVNISVLKEISEGVEDGYIYELTAMSFCDRSVCFEGYEEPAE